MVFTAASRTQIHESDRRWIWKFCFRIVATVFSLVGIGCTAWAVSANAHLKDTTQQGFWLVVWLLIPVSSCADGILSTIKANLLPLTLAWLIGDLEHHQLHRSCREKQTYSSGS